jgi:hypothetical protein
MVLDEAAIERLRKAVAETTCDERFEILGEVATGGMGRILEARERDSGRRVAIKVVAGTTEHARLFAEAEALEQLVHPNIVRYVCHGATEDGAPYLAMEWLDGETLADRLERGPLAIGEALALGEQLAAALDCAHARGVLHRDLKPSNVFLLDGRIDRVKVIDFGIAKLPGRVLTRSGQFVGTPGYMAPEQIRGERSIDRRVDLFALGCVLYVALSGRLPFDGNDTLELFARILLEKPPPIDELVPEIPPRLARLVAALLAKHPGKRVGTAELVQRELATIRDGIARRDLDALERSSPDVPVQSRGDAPTRTSPASAPPARSRACLVIATAGALVACGVAAIAWYARGDAPRCAVVDTSGCEALCDRRALGRKDLGSSAYEPTEAMMHELLIAIVLASGCSTSLSSLLTPKKEAPSHVKGPDDGWQELYCTPEQGGDPVPGPSPVCGTSDYYGYGCKQYKDRIDPHAVTTEDKNEHVSIVPTGSEFERCLPSCYHTEQPYNGDVSKAQKTYQGCVHSFEYLCQPQLVGHWGDSGIYAAWNFGLVTDPEPMPACKFPTAPSPGKWKKQLAFVLQQDPPKDGDVTFIPADASWQDSMRALDGSIFRCAVVDKYVRDVTLQRNRCSAASDKVVCEASGSRSARAINVAHFRLDEAKQLQSAGNTAGCQQAAKEALAVARGVTDWRRWTKKQGDWEDLLVYRTRYDGPLTEDALFAKIDDYTKQALAEYHACGGKDATTKMQDEQSFHDCW